MVPPAPPPPLRLVIVDDDRALRAALTFSLGLDGFQVEACGSGEALLAHELPERGCLVIDQRLPGISGLDALRALRARGVALPALLITTDPNRRLRAAAAEAGASIVEKPLL